MLPPLPPTPELVARRAAVLITAGATLAHGMDAGHAPGRVRAERLYAQRAVVGDRQRASRPASSTVGLVVVVIPVPRAAEARCRNQAADRAWIRRGGQGYGAVIGDRHGAPGAGGSLVDASATHCVCHDDTADGIPGHGVRETGAGRVRRLGVDRYARSGITVLLILVIDTTVAPTGRPCVSIVDLADRLGCISIATRIRLAGQGRPAEPYGQHDQKCDVFRSDGNAAWTPGPNAASEDLGRAFLVLVACFIRCIPRKMALIHRHTAANLAPPCSTCECATR